MKIKVVPFKTRKQRMEEYARAEREFNNIYVKNLPEDLTEEQLKEKFAAFGEIESVKLAVDTASGTPASKGFGFVKYKDAASARAAVDELNGSKMGEKELFVGRAMKKAERLAMLRRQYDQRRNERSRAQVSVGGGRGGELGWEREMRWERERVCVSV